MNPPEELKIVGIDSSRFPKINKAPYINLVFKLSEKVTDEWCQDFNGLFANAEYSVKVDKVDRIYIETWVRTMDEIPGHLEMLKEKVAESNKISLDREIARAKVITDGNEALAGEKGQQGLLNKVIADLNFD